MNDNKITVAQIANLDSSGMCYVIHLSDGTFIIIDGGEADELGAGIYDFNSRALKDHLMRVTGGEKPIISAWFITHFHLDHIDLATRFIKEQNTPKARALKERLDAVHKEFGSEIIETE